MGWKTGAGLLLAGWTFANTSFLNTEDKLGLCMGVKPFGDAHEVLHKIGLMGPAPLKYCLKPEIQKSPSPVPPVSK